ncbi:MAG: hypothetical protein AAGF96_06025 [Bacteroidota bacterium]
MKKRLFQVLDEMNQEDAEKGTKMVSVSSSFVRGNKVSQGAEITIGTEFSGLMDLWDDKVIPVLLLIDKKEYFKRTKSNS